jgi:inorganic triphosphatase YgiF
MSDGSGGKVEIERKYSVGADFAVPDLSAVPGVAAVTSPQTYHLTAVYHDTPGFRLAAAHITLRRRTGGTDAGWHLKLPAGTARREVHAPLGAATGGVPAELTSLVADVTGGEPLRPIARLRTTRTVRHLLDAAGRVLAEVADDHVRGSLPAAEAGATGEAEEARATNEAGTTGEAQAASWREANSWREVEVELDDGTPDLLDAAEPLLFAAGARPSPAASKLSLLLTAAGALPG